MPDGELDHLVERARTGAPDALAQLCARLYPKILQYMRYRVSRDHAEDLAEEVFLRVVRSIGDQRGSFHAWLYRIASNVVAQWLRDKHRDQRVTVSDAAIEHSTARTADPAVSVQRRLDLAAAIEQLTDEQREFVTLKFIQGHSNDLIGRITGRTPGAIRALQFRALAALRELLGDQPAP